MGNGVNRILGFSICWCQVKERYIRVNWTWGNREGVRAVCLFPDYLADAVNDLSLGAVVEDLLSYLS